MQILNFGSLNIDFVYQVEHFVQKGETLSSQRLDTFCGGKGLNQSIALARAGVAVAHAGAVGTDGEMLLEMLKSAGVNIDGVEVLTEVRSGNAIIQVDRAGDNCILLYGGSNQAITKAHVDKVLTRFSKGDYLLLQNEINHLDYLVQRANEKGMKIFLNPSPMNKELLKIDFNLVDCFILNEIEANQILQKEEMILSAEELSKAMQQKFPQAEIVLTLGERGSYYISKGEICYQPIFKVEVVDTTAAGDTFTGYYIASMIQGKTNQEALKIASKAASITVSGEGAAPSIPHMDEVIAGLR